MKLSGVTILALSAVLTLVVRSGTAVAAEFEQTGLFQGVRQHGLG